MLKKKKAAQSRKELHISVDFHNLCKPYPCGSRAVLTIAWALLSSWGKFTRISEKISGSPGIFSLSDSSLYKWCVYNQVNRNKWNGCAKEPVDSQPLWRFWDLHHPHMHLLLGFLAKVLGAACPLLRELPVTCYLLTRWTTLALEGHSLKVWPGPCCLVSKQCYDVTDLEACQIPLFSLPKSSISWQLS